MNYRYFIVSIVCAVMCLGFYISRSFDPGTEEEDLAGAYFEDIPEQPVRRAQVVFSEPQQEKIAQFTQVLGEITPTCDMIDKVVAGCEKRDPLSCTTVLEKGPEWGERLNKLYQDFMSLLLDPDLQPFLEALGLRTDFDEASRLISCGQRLEQVYTTGPWTVGKMLVENIRTKIDGNVTLDDISGVAWYLYKLAVDQKQSFTRGIISVYDKYSLLFDFLKKSGAAHPSYSVHFPEISEHFSITIGDATQYGLPHGMKRILFGHNNTVALRPITYLMFQEYEAGYGTLVSRGLLSAVRALQAIRGSTPSPGQQDIRLDEQQDIRLDVMPQAFNDLWNAIKDSPYFKDKITPEDQELVDRAGIAGIETFIGNCPLRGVASEQTQVLAGTFYGLVLGTPYYSHPHVRRGNEVILRSVPGLSSEPEAKQAVSDSSSPEPDPAQEPE